MLIRDEPACADFVAARPTTLSLRALVASSVGAVAPGRHGRADALLPQPAANDAVPQAATARTALQPARLTCLR
jgi:hypothetical protein